MFKYCSTFDSTREGNIGPVADALDAKGVLVCPAFPTTGRTVYQGHLLVGDVLLNGPGMQNHPLTPMNESDIRRWLRHQTESGFTISPGRRSLQALKRRAKRYQRRRADLS